MATKFLETTDATFLATSAINGGLWSSTSGAPAVVTDFVHGSHVKSVRYRPSNQDTLITANGTVADAGARISVYIYLAALPSATAILFEVRGLIVRLRITSGGVLQLWQGANVNQIGSNGSTLSTGTWYRLSLAYTITSTTVNQFRVFKNGTLDISVTNATLSATGSSSVRFGNVDLDSALDFRSSDHYIDDSNALTDTGDIWVTAKRPNANGTLNEFTTQVGVSGSGYGSGHSPQVNERALNTANGWSISTSSVIKTEEYSIESASTGDIDISGATIIDYIGWIAAKVNTASSNTPKIIVNGVATTIVLTTTDTTYTAAAGSSTYPAGNTAIGMVVQAAISRIFTLDEAGIMVAYIPSTSGAAPSVSDTVTVTESVTVSLVHRPNVNDTVTVTESVAMVVSFNVSDIVTVTDVITDIIRGGIRNPSVSDMATIAENITINLKPLPNVNDTVTITESVSLIPALNISPAGGFGEKRGVKIIG